MPRHFALGWRIPLAPSWPMSPTSPAARWGQRDSFNWRCVFFLFWWFLQKWHKQLWAGCEVLVENLLRTGSMPKVQILEKHGISWNVYLTHRFFGWKFKDAKLASFAATAGGSDADGWPPVRQMLAWVLWRGAGSWIWAVESMFAKVWAAWLLVWSSNCLSIWHGLIWKEKVTELFGYFDIFRPWAGPFRCSL